MIYDYFIYYLLSYVDSNEMTLHDSIYNNSVNAYSQKRIKSKNQSITFFIQSLGYLGSVNLNEQIYFIIIH